MSSKKKTDQASGQEVSEATDWERVMTCLESGQEVSNSTDWEQVLRTLALHDSTSKDSTVTMSSTVTSSSTGESKTSLGDTSVADPPSESSSSKSLSVSEDPFETNESKEEDSMDMTAARGLDTTLDQTVRPRKVQYKKPKVQEKAYVTMFHPLQNCFLMIGFHYTVTGTTFQKIGTATIGHKGYIWIRIVYPQSFFLNLIGKARRGEMGMYEGPDMYSLVKPNGEILVNVYQPVSLSTSIEVQCSGQETLLSVTGLDNSTVSRQIHAICSKKWPLYQANVPDFEFFLPTQALG